MPCQVQNRFASDPVDVMGGGEVAEPNQLRSSAYERPRHFVADRLGIPPLS
jgi:hypothetical protein